MSRWLTYRVTKIMLDQKRFNEFKNLLKEWAKVNNVNLVTHFESENSIEVSIDNTLVAISLVQDSLRIAIPDYHSKTVKIGGKTYSIIEKIEELAVAADYIVSAEELGYMIEEIDLREEATVRTTQQQEELVDTEDLLIQL